MTARMTPENVREHGGGQRTHRTPTARVPWNTIRVTWVSVATVKLERPIAGQPEPAEEAPLSPLPAHESSRRYAAAM